MKQTVATGLRRTLRHPLTNSILGLYGIQIATFLIPLVMLPYVARTLDPSGFGLVILGQGLAFALLIVIDWGFGLAGVRAVASNQDDPDAIAEVVQRTRGAQLLLSFLCAPLVLGAFLVVPAMRSHPEFLGLAYVAAVASGLAPDWYFQGIERLRVVAATNLVCRGAGAVLTLIVVKQPEDAWIVMALFAASSVGVLLTTEFLLRRDVRVGVSGLRQSLQGIREGSMLFFGVMASGLYTTLNVVLLGLFATSAQVAHFGAAERIVRITIMVLGPIGGAVLPRITALQAAGKQDRARRLFLLAVAAASIPAAVLAVGLFVLAEPIVELVFGEKFVGETVGLLQILVLIIPLSMISVCSVLWIVTLNRDRVAVAVVCAAGIANVALAFIVVPRYGPEGMAWVVVSAEAVGAVAAIAAMRLIRDRRPVVPRPGIGTA